MSSEKPAAELALEQGLPTTAEDVRALRAAAAPHALAPADYLRFLRLVKASYEELRRRPVFKGEPFTLR